MEHFQSEISKLKFENNSLKCSYEHRFLEYESNEETNRIQNQEEIQKIVQERDDIKCVIKI